MIHSDLMDYEDGEYADEDGEYAGRTWTALPTIKAPEGYRPIFHDMGGLTAEEYRLSQMGHGQVTKAQQVIATYRRTQSWNETARFHCMSAYHVKKIVRGK